MTYEMNEIFEKVLARIKPEQQVFREVDETIKKINSLLNENKIRAMCAAAGSYAKGTILYNDFDVDLFVRFDYDYKDSDKNSKDNISDLLANAISSLKPERIHGSRDYFQLKTKNIMYEIIPVLMIDDYEKAENVTDMSPLHVSYVRKHFDDKPGMTDQIRLAKQFCKSAKIYGAESYINGFSGHVLDLLVIYYGSFENLLMQATVWGNRVIIDIEHHLKDAEKELNRAKTESPLIIVDPIQPNRNAAAALSSQAFEAFKQKAREFLENPDESFFEIRKINVAELKKKAGKDWLLLIDAVPTSNSKDISGTKILKCFEKMQSEIRKNDFRIIEADWEFEIEKSLIYFIIKHEELSEKILLRGPPIKAEADSARFRQKHSRIIEKEKRLFAEEKRKYMTPRELMIQLINSKYIKDRVQSISME